ECVRQTELYIRTCPDWVKESAAQTIAHGVSRLSATKTACLLHDIGKPGTWEVTEEGRHTFLGHDKLGATMTTELAKEHRWSKQLGRFVAGLVKWHLRPGHLFHQGQPTEKAINKFYR
ncbi:MAG TPA: HD domain-containing protein, partial [Candidatus Melainabacteria bacterium]|nr:HD domain-containing protein [Candidatus Melainabacteria bacterium]